MSDPHIDDLLDGLEGPARAERAELIAWLLTQGITVEEIRGVQMPLLLASRRVIGDDGSVAALRWRPSWSCCGPAWRPGRR